MTTTTTIPLPQTAPTPPGADKTTAGNYFVANYPPFSFWKPERVPELAAALDQPPRPDTDLGLYVHIPFCRKRCHFCYFKVYTDKNSSEIREYLDALIGELAMYSHHAFVGGRRPSFVYFGGGTPSYLSPDQLRYLFYGLQALLPWDRAREIAFEGEPGTLNELKLATLKELGVTRLSLGVENFDQAILEVNGRAHGAKEIDKAYDAARRVGFDQINIDLIAGMVNETEDNWRRNIERTIALSPECVTIYQMEIPYNTTIYKEMKAAGRIDAPVAEWHTKRAWVTEAFAALERAGYTVTSAYTAVKDPSRVKFVYRDSLWHGADMLALGVASFGHISGVHYQNQADFNEYIAAVERRERPVYRAMSITTEEALIRELVLQFKLGSLDPGYFRQKFGVDIRERFRAALDEIRAEKMLAPGGDTPDRIALTRDGLLQVDRLLHAFFLPEHRTARYT